jgi:hypothetical protein
MNNLFKLCCRLPYGLSSALLMCWMVLNPLGARAQLTLGTSPYVQNFNGMGTTTTLPTGWGVWTAVNNSNGSGTRGTAGSIANATAAWTSTTGAFVNYASGNSPSTSSDAVGVQNANVDRCIGVRQVGGTDASGAFPAFALQLTNTTGLSSFTVSVKVQSLDATGAPRSVTWKLQYGTGTNPTNFTDVAFSPSNPITGNNTFTNTTVTATLPSAINNLSGNVWIRVVPSAVSTGSGNRPTTTIDDFVLSWSGSPTLTFNPTLGNGYATTTQGTASTPAQSATFTASNLSPASGTITMTAPTNWEVSSNGGASYASTATYSYTGGAIGSSTLTYRLASTASIGTNQGNISATNGVGGSLTNSPQILPVYGTVQANLYWNGTGGTCPTSTGGNGTWDAASTNWCAGSSSVASSSSPHFLANTAGTINLGNAYTAPASALTVNTTGYTISTTSSSTAAITPSISLANNVTLNLQPNTTNAGGQINIGGASGTGTASLNLISNNTSGVARIGFSGAGTISVPTTVSGTGTVPVGYTSGNGIATISGAITNNASGTGALTMLGATSGNTLTMSAGVGGSQGLQFSAGASGGAGTILLNAANTYSGATIFNAATGGIIRNGIANALPTGTDVNMAFSSSNGGILDLNNFNQTIASVTSGVGGGSITNQNASAGTSTLTINGSSRTSFGLAITKGTLGDVALVRGGTGATVLTSNASTFTGGISVTGGNLLFNTASAGTLSASNAVTLSGGQFGGTGTVPFPITANANGGLNAGDIDLATGNTAPGTFTTSGNITLNNNARLVVDFNNASPIAADKVVGNTITISANSSNPVVIDLRGLTAANALGVVPNFSSVGSYTLTILQATNLSGFAANKFSLDLTNFDSNNGGYTGAWTVVQSGNNVNLVYTPPPASLVLSPTSINLGNTFVNTPTTGTAFTIANPSGTNTPLSPSSGNLTVTAPAGFEISTDAGATWGSSDVFAYSTANFSAASGCRVRIAANATSGSISGNVQITGGGLPAAAELPVNGVVLAPTITTTGTTLHKVYANEGFNSDTLNFSISGSNLVANVVVTAPTGWRISSNNSTFSTSVTLSPVSNAISATTLYLRIPSSIAVGSVDGNLTISTTAFTTVNKALVGQVYAGASAFTAGNLVVYRAGETGGIGGSSSACPGFLDEYTPSGTLVQSVALPFNADALGSGNARLTASTTSLSEGYLNLSPDGKYLTFTGYDVPVNTATVVSTTTSSTLNNRVVARVTQDGTINTTTRIHDGFSGNNVRSAVTVNGNSFWVAGANGFRYVNLGNDPTSGGSSTSLATGSPNVRVANISGSKIYVSSGSGAVGIGVNAVSGNLPTTAGQTFSLPVMNSGSSMCQDPYNFVFFDRDASISGNDLVYVANGSGQSAPNLGLYKYSIGADGKWTQRGVIQGEFRGVTGRVNPSTGNVELVVTVGSGAPNTLYRIVDATAYNANLIYSNPGITIAANPSVSALNTLATTYPLITHLGNSPSNTVFKGISYAPVDNPTPTISHFWSTPGTSSLVQNTTAVSNPLTAVQVDVTLGNAILTGAKFTTAGTYSGASFTNFKLYGSTDNVLDAGDALISTISTSSGPGQLLNFSSLAYSISVDDTRYLILAADVSNCATIGNSISINAGTLTDFTYVDANKLGTPAASTAKTVVAGTPDDVATPAASSGTPPVYLSWSEPTCLSDVMIVAHTAPITGVPSGNAYTANSNYASAPAFAGGGKVVFKGLYPGSLVTTTGYTLGTVYYFKFFVRNGTLWSPGVEVTAIPDEYTLYSRGSGDASTAAIWSYFPNGVGQTITALGGFTNAKNIRIQSGHTVQITQSSITCNDLIVNSGGRLMEGSSVSANMKYVTVQGDNVTINGVLGGTTFDAIGLNIEGSTCTLSGTGNISPGRIRKSTASPNATTTLTVTASTVNLRFPGSALYNNTDASTFNVTINQGSTVNVTDASGDVAIDGTDGSATGERGGTLTINGTLTVQGKLWHRTNNTVRPVALTVGSTGIITTRNFEQQSTGLSGLGSGPSTTFAAGSQLNITGVMRITGGTFNPPSGVIRLKSTSNKQGMIDGTTAGTVSNNIWVETYLTARGYHNITNPTSTSLSTAAHLGDDCTIQGSPSNYVYNLANYVTQPTVFPTIWSYDPTIINTQQPGWICASADNMTSGKGYVVNLTSLNTTFDYLGDATVGTIPVTVSSLNAGFNLLGNPYPSSLSWNAFRATNASRVANNLVIYNAANQNYAQFNGTAWTNNGVGITNDNIGVGQGFFVQATSSGTVNFLTGHRTTTLPYAFLDAPVAQPQMLRMQVKLGTQSDDLVVYAQNNASNDLDDQDAVKFGGEIGKKIRIFTLAENRALAIQALENWDESTVIPVGVETGIAGVVTFEGMEMPGKTVYLEDAQTGKWTNLSSSSYSVNLAEGSSGSRFFLHLSPKTQAGVVNEEPGIRLQGKELLIISKEAVSGTLQWFNMLGNLVKEEAVQLGSGQNAFPAFEGASGTYLVKLSSQLGVQTQKVNLSK